MSNRKKKFKMKKPLTQKEQERRALLREQRETRKKAEKRKRIRSLLEYSALILFGCLLFFLFAFVDDRYDTISFIYYLGVLAFIGFILCDNSGIRRWIFSRYPEKMPFADKLKRPDCGQCKLIELCKTCSYYSMLFYIYLNGFAVLWTAVWISCSIISFFFLIFDDDTRMRSEKTAENGLSAAGSIVLLPSIAMFGLSIDNFFINSRIVIFTAVFTVSLSVLYLAVSSDWHEHKDYAVIFVLSAMIFSFSAFSAVNRDFDFSEPQKYEAVIIDKRSVSGGHHSYYLSVDDWHESGGIIDIDVSVDVFRQIDIGDKINILEYGGALGMEYYVYGEKQD